MSIISPDLVHIYLQEIGRFPLLTPEEEITYARLVQQMIAIEQKKKELTIQPDIREYLVG